MAETTKTEKAAAKKAERQRRMMIKRIKSGAMLCIVLAVLLYLLSAFVFFKIGNIEVVGAADENGEGTMASSYYLNDDIIRISGVQTGDSLVRVSGKNVSRNIETLLPYIGKAEIKRKFPSTLRIIVEDTSAFFALETGGYYTVLDRNFKVLSLETDVPADCAKVVGVAVSTADVGSKAEFTDKAFLERIENLVSACEESGINNLTKIDLSNIANVRIVLGGRVTFILGTLTDLDKKLEMGKKTMEAEFQTNPDAHILIDLTEKDRSYVRNDYTPIEDVTDNDVPDQPDSGDGYNDDYDDYDGDAVG